MATNLQFIKSESATSVTNFDMTDCFDNGYSVHKIIIPKYKFSQATNLYLRFFDSSGSIITGSEYDCADLQLISSTTYTEHNAVATTSVRYIASMGTGTAYGGGIEINIFNAKDSGSYTFVTWQTSNFYTSQLLGYKGIGVHKTAEVIKGFRLTTISYTLDHISASVFGVQ